MSVALNYLKSVYLDLFTISKKQKKITNKNFLTKKTKPILVNAA